MSRIKDLRMKLTEEEVKNILAKHGAYVHTETDSALIYPTVCHNLEGGSPKLYYYKDEKIFRCYTQCHSMFDIFELLMKMKKLRGEEITLREAIALTGVEEDDNGMTQEMLSDLEYLQRLKKTNDILRPDGPIRTLDKKIIDSFMFNEIGLQPWIEEGIGIPALERFSIRYDSTKNAIIIPNLNHKGELIGIRGRFLGENAIAKYMPIKFGDEILSHPTGKFLYGYYENKHQIRKKGIVVLFEGEKSVLKMETMYPDNNVSLATAGSKITLDQLGALLKLNINEVVLAYDKDFRNSEERKELLAKYEQIVQILKPYFEVSIIVDYENQLGYKDSPIDKGKEIFEELMRNRVKR